MEKVELFEKMENYADIKNAEFYNMSDESKKTLNKAIDDYKKENRAYDEDIFKFSHNVGTWGTYRYFVNCAGTIRVVNINKEELDNLQKNPEEMKKWFKNNESKHKDPHVENGYIKETEIVVDGNTLNLTTTTDIYKFMEYAGWLDNDKEEATRNFKEKYSTNKELELELHHIDNNPANNHLSNLIYLPKEIHRWMH